MITTEFIIFQQSSQFPLSSNIAVVALY